jgi:hypothetical protein
MVVLQSSGLGCLRPFPFGSHLKLFQLLGPEVSDLQLFTAFVFVSSASHHFCPGYSLELFSYPLLLLPLLPAAAISVTAASFVVATTFISCYQIDPL